jgi:hypothetical protein
MPISFQCILEPRLQPAGACGFATRSASLLDLKPSEVPVRGYGSGNAANAASMTVMASVAIRMIILPISALSLPTSPGPLSGTRRRGRSPCNF